MASINIFVTTLIVTVVMVPFVENAPSNTMRTASSQEEQQSRVVFIDRDSNDQSNGYPQIITHSTLPPLQTIYQEGKNNLINSQNFAGSLPNYPKPISEIKTSKPSVLSGMDDDRRIWGVTVEDKIFEEDDSYYNRPLALPKTIFKIPIQARKSVIPEELKVEAPINVRKPSECDMSILICCSNNSSKLKCFKSNGCINVTEDMFQNLCSAESIKSTINDISKYYKGNQEK